MRNYRHIEVRPISGALGAEIAGVDMARDLDAEVVARGAPGAARPPGDLPARPEGDAGAAARLRASKFGEPVEYPQLKGLPECADDHAGGEARARAQQLRRHLALRHDLPADPADGQHAAGARGAALWRRHHVRQPVPRLRGAVGRPEADARRADRRQLLGQGGRDEDARGCAEAGGRARDSQGARSRASARAHPSRDRPQGALHLGRAHRPHQGLDREGEPAAARVPVGAPGEARVHLPLPAGRSGSLAFWDNRCAMHNPINDYHGFRRVMHRITLAGDKPR